MLAPLANAPRTIEAEFVFPCLAHAPMEPLNCTVQLSEGRAELWVGTQFPGVDSAAAARVLGLKPEQVKMNVQMAGGGFGRRGLPSSDYVVEACEIANAARAAGINAPVRIVKNGIDATATEGMREPYGLPMRLTVHHPKVNVPVLWRRSVGSTHTAFAMETLLDDIARATKQDPVLHRVHCNLAINPKSVETQVQGAAVMGLSMCLPGSAITLKDGVVEQGNFGDFTMARIADMPEINVHVVPSADPPTGIGEPGLPPLAPAFANAIAQLTGKPLRELPFKLA